MTLPSQSNIQDAECSRQRAERGSADSYSRRRRSLSPAPWLSVAANSDASDALKLSSPSPFGCLFIVAQVRWLNRPFQFTLVEETFSIRDSAVVSESILLRSADFGLPRDMVAPLLSASHRHCTVTMLAGGYRWQRLERVRCDSTQSYVPPLHQASIIVDDNTISCRFRRLVAPGRLQWAQSSGGYTVVSKSILLRSASL